MLKRKKKPEVIVPDDLTPESERVYWYTFDDFFPSKEKADDDS